MVRHEHDQIAVAQLRDDPTNQPVVVLIELLDRITVI
jgi:hypothetical protein